MGQRPLSDTDDRLVHARAPKPPASDARRGRRASPLLPAGHEPVTSRVIVVDDNEWVRRGRAEALREAAWPGDVLALDHAAALDMNWLPGDTVLVDAFDPVQAWDRYVGVAVVSAVREQVGDDASLVVMTDGPPRSLLAERAAEAGADFVVPHDRARDVDELLGLVRDPASFAERLTVGRRGLTEALAIVDELDARGLFTAPMLQKQSDLSRRNIITLRQRLARTLGIEPTPRLRDLIETINDARGAPEAALHPLHI